MKLMCICSCNDTRGWFPSNYVRVIEEHPEFEHNDDTIEVVSINLKSALLLI